MRPSRFGFGVAATALVGVAVWAVSADTQTVSQYPNLIIADPPSEMTEEEGMEMINNHRAIMQSALLGEVINPEQWAMELLVEAPGSRDESVLAVDDHDNLFEVQLFSPVWVDAADVNAENPIAGAELAQMQFRGGFADALIVGPLGETMASVLVMEWTDAETDELVSVAIPLLISSIESIVHVIVDPKITREQLLQCLYEKENAKRKCRESVFASFLACNAGGIVGCLISGPAYLPCMGGAGIVCATGGIAGTIIACNMLTGDDEFNQCMYRELGIGPMLSYAAYLYWQEAFREAMDEHGF